MRYAIAINDARTASEYFRRKMPGSHMVHYDLKVIEEYNPEVIFFPHWSEKIPLSIYGNYECILFHMTDLPYGRGGSPLQNLIKRGLETTYVSALQVVEEVDAGPIYMKRFMPIDGTAEEIYRRTSKTVFDMIERLVLHPRKPYPQPQSGGSDFKRRAPGQSWLEPGLDARGIYDHIRMLDAEGYPKAFTNSDGYRFEFTEAELLHGKVTAKVSIV